MNMEKLMKDEHELLRVSYSTNTARNKKLNAQNIPTQLIMDHLIRSWIFMLRFIHNKQFLAMINPPIENIDS